MFFLRPFVSGKIDRLNAQSWCIALNVGLGERLGEEVCDVVVGVDGLDVNDPGLLLLLAAIVQCWVTWWGGGGRCRGRSG